MEGPAAPERGRRKSMVGTVVSVKMDKTAVVAVERRVRHPLYRKIIRRTKRYKAHDALNAAVLGDVVRIEETRPISKEKRWRIAETLTRGNVAEIAPREIGAPEEALLTLAPTEETAAAPAAIAAEPVAEPAEAPATTAAEPVAEPAEAPATTAAEPVAEPAEAPATTAAEPVAEPAEAAAPDEETRA